MKKSERNRRQHRRYPVKAVWAHEFSGDYQYRLTAENISASGIFLTGHSKITHSPSRLVIHLGRSGRQPLEVMASPIHDRVITKTRKKSVGIGFQFTKLSAEQNKILTSYLRNLD